ncbi:pectinesterase [Marchantia polymorpha subsp. ruderalis]|nr:hypothetical protein AXG93_773s1060 [Marchantia polymorpha subsp. ruderalis]PTQ50037.1 hypothetical protein MARPO_0001s0096 [Marchantia polymorpha]BBM98961.1 hypothetical protein Mp_1g17560 [Marchantia polymorpha subsp. ruderalis]|eukprot:PTQ50037.1 hypothetical protein MARPO_0001s0096 [Marchantia polymorpha]
MGSKSERWGSPAFVVLCTLCILFRAAVGSSTTSPSWTSVSDPRVWQEPDGFQAWLQYVHRTSDLASDWATHSKLDTTDVTPLGGPNDDEQTNSTEHNLLQVKRKIVVDQSGKGDCRTIKEAIDLVPPQNRERIVIHIRPGVYREKVKIPKTKPYITFEGYSNNQTIITYNSTASDPKSKKHHTYLRTYNSATVAVNSKYFVAVNIVFQNSAPAPPPGSIGKQAVAFRISADMAAFYNCQFLGFQDTLYDHHGRHYFKNCYIEGAVDFIFGNGRSLYKNCVLNALNNSGIPGSLTAQKRNDTTLDTGFSFVDSYISGSGQVYLGRAWGNDSRVVFARSYMDDVVLPVGWNDWGSEGRERTSYYAEYNCSGPGAVTSGRAPWARVLTEDEAKPFLSMDFINGKRWLPKAEITQ